MSPLLPSLVIEVVMNVQPQVCGYRITIRGSGNVKIGKSGQRLGNFSGVGKGLAKICVVVSLYMSTTYENENFRWDFHTAEVTDSSSVPPI